LKFGAEEGQRRSFGPIVLKMKYYIASKRKGKSYIKYREGILIVLVTSCVGTAL